MTMEKQGVVCLVGAGPGDPGLITVKGLARLRKCDAVVYDHLASERLLDETPAGCRRIYVGKRAGLHSMKQEEINQVLVDLAKEGLSVVRLKGGDPFVFGRGGEEILRLQKEGIPYEVISGVTSAVAALSGAGIPVTHRALSRSFHVMTGHTMTENGSLPPDFPEFARLSGTLIFLMGLGNLPAIVEGLLKAGKLGDTPAAVISNGTLPSQKSVKGTLSQIEEKVRIAGLETPAIIVVGETAALSMASTFHAPLEGVRIGVTGTESFTEKLMGQLEEQGAETECILRLDVVSHKGETPMQEAYGRLSEYTWLVFTSANAVREFFLGLSESGKDHRCLGHMKFAAVGKGTAGELKRYGFQADYVPGQYRVGDLAEGLRELVSQSDRLLIPRSSGGSPELAAMLKEKGIVYDNIALYDITSRTKPGEDMAGSLEKLDYVTFASASGVEAFFERLEEGSRRLLDALKVVCIGDVTAKALKRHGRCPDLTAETFSIQGIADAILADCQNS